MLTKYGYEDMFCPFWKFGFCVKFKPTLYVGTDGETRSCCNYLGFEGPFKLLLSEGREIAISNCGDGSAIVPSMNISSIETTYAKSRELPVNTQGTNLK